MLEILDNSFAKKLYNTYLSCLPKEKVSLPLKINYAPRGSFTELLKTASCGQFSVNISKPETQSFLWIFRSDEDRLPAIVLYGYSPTRSGS